MAETFNPNPTPKEALEETLHTNAGTGDIATLARALLRISEEYHRLLRSEGKTGSVFETGRKTGPVDTMPSLLNSPQLRFVCEDVRSGV